MKAYVLHAVGDLRYEDVPMPECQEGWALVEVRASGICSSDVARVHTTGTYHFPTIPGHEFAGIVRAVGSPEDSPLIGRRVGVFPLIPCHSCGQCRQGHYEMCSGYDYLGSRRDGGFAEYVAVPTWNLTELPADAPYTLAAMLEPLSVGLHAVKRAGADRAASVAVVGTGMIGISAAWWALRKGAGSVTVTGRSEAKRSVVERCGLTYKVAPADGDGAEYDVVLEAVGSPEAAQAAIKATAPGGTLLLMGNPQGDMLLPKAVYWRILRKQLTLRGTWNSSFAGTDPSDWTEAAAALSDGRDSLEPLISHVFSQEHLKEGLAIMKNHTEPYCKVMTTWNDGKKE